MIWFLQSFLLVFRVFIATHEYFRGHVSLFQLMCNILIEYFDLLLLIIFIFKLLENLLSFLLHHSLNRFWHFFWNLKTQFRWLFVFKQQGQRSFCCLRFGLFLTFCFLFFNLIFWNFNHIFINFELIFWWLIQFSLGWFNTFIDL